LAESGSPDGEFGRSVKFQPRSCSLTGLGFLCRSIFLSIKDWPRLIQEVPAVLLQLLLLSFVEETEGDDGIEEEGVFEKKGIWEAWRGRKWKCLKASCDRCSNRSERHFLGYFVVVATPTFLSKLRICGDIRIWLAEFKLCFGF
jgi:hypothetical protein